MMSRLVAVFLILVSPGWAQFSGSDQTSCTLRVDVIDRSGAHVASGLRVELLESMNNSGIAVNMTSSSGSAEFSGLRAGGYRLVVSGSGIQTTQGGIFQIEGGKAFETETIVVRKLETGQNGDRHPVAASDLNVPKDAVKEFEKASKEIAKQNWGKAIDHLNKATTIYPQYSSAYNNLAICYERLGQKDREKEALQKAISINEHYVPALINLAHMAVADNNFAEAGRILNKAIATDPTNLEALALLSRVDFMQARYDQAIADAHKVHAMPHENYAMVHFTAAGAFEREGRIADAIAELQTFLHEQPKGPRADAVRKLIPQLQKESH